MKVLHVTAMIIAPILTAGCVLGEWEVEGSYCDGDILVAECQPAEGEEPEEDCTTETDCMAANGVGCMERRPGYAICAQKDPGCNRHIFEFCYSENVVGGCLEEYLSSLKACPDGEVCYDYLEYGTYYATCIPTE